MSRRSTLGRAAASVAAPAIAVVLLHQLGRGPMGGPDGFSLESVRSWLDAADPVLAGLSVVRLLALAAAYHLLATTVLALLAGAIRRPDMGRSLQRFALPPLRSLVGRALGIGLAASAAVSAPAVRAEASGAAGSGGVAVMRVVEEQGVAVLARVSPVVPTQGVDTTTESTATTSGMATVTPVDGPEGTATLSVQREGTGGSDVPTPVAPLDVRTFAGQVTEPGQDEYVVRPGDHLWSIARSTLSARSTPAAADDVERYWHQLVLANPQLVDPDLVFPGDVIALPPVAPR